MMRLFKHQCGSQFIRDMGFSTKNADTKYGPDWLLIYSVNDEHVHFDRTGSHSDLFK
ncbi:hypothetical protein GGR10_001256 [Bartonella chomelii]|uniref:mRNA interferase YafQ n=1 Tax=Bartonella chomelii TaxID=236402 RepID=A0ABR6E4B2_9HYPH|nr:hypothetical protein [Bartonella chomelii]